MRATKEKKQNFSNRNGVDIHNLQVELPTYNCFGNLSRFFFCLRTFYLLFLLSPEFVVRMTSTRKVTTVFWYFGSPHLNQVKAFFCINIWYSNFNFVFFFVSFSLFLSPLLVRNKIHESLQCMTIFDHQIDFLFLNSFCCSYFINVDFPLHDTSVFSMKLALVFITHFVELFMSIVRCVCFVVGIFVGKRVFKPTNFKRESNIFQKQTELKKRKINIENQAENYFTKQVGNGE